MSKEIGTLVVVVLKARNLPDKHSLYKQDVFAQAAIHDKIKRTGIDVKGGQHPVWDEELRFPIFKSTSANDRILEVSCWRKEPREEEVIGNGKVDISDTLRTGEFDDWVQLEDNGAYRGEIYLEMTYFASGPTPLQRRPSKLPTSERLNRPAQPYAYTNPKIPPKTPTKPSPSPSPPSSARYDQASFNMATTSPYGLHLVAPSSNHTSPRTSPRSRYDALPPIPQEHIVPDNIPEILRPGNPKSDIHYSDKPHPPGFNASSRPAVSPPHSPPLRGMPVLPHPSPGPSFVPPQSLRPGPFSRERLPSNASQLPPNLLSPENPLHARYPATPPRTPPLPAVPVPVPALPPQPQPASGLSYAPPSQRGGPHPPVRPYPYNYAPTLPSPEPSPALISRYMAPLPLPDEPEGVHTPTPAHPQPYIDKADPRKQPPLPERHARSQSEDVAEKDELLAKQLEEEEERKRREAEEREREDEELAKKLDLELNLAQAEEDTRPDSAFANTDTQPNTGSSMSSARMPGSW